MLFREIIGQNALKKKLITAVQHGRVSHAQLFLGKSGYGCLPLAIAYAQYINCENKGPEDSCGTCKSCIKHAKLSHPDLHFSYPFNKTRDLSKSTAEEFLPQWRKQVESQPYFDLAEWFKAIDVENKQGIINVSEGKRILQKLSLKPFEAEFKVLIIWRADKLNSDTSNKLLKLIEEPSPKTLILLLAEEEDQLLKTISSRTQIIRVPPLDPESLSDHLISEKGIDKNKSAAVVKLVAGDLLFAYKKIEVEEEEQLFFDLFKTWMRVSYKADIQGIYAWVEEICSSKIGRERQKSFLLYALNLMREGLMLNYSGNQLNNTIDEEAQFVKNFAPFVHANNVFAMSEILNDAHQHISRNAYGKILFMDLSMKFANLLHVKNVHL